MAKAWPKEAHKILRDNYPTRGRLEVKRMMAEAGYKHSAKSITTMARRKGLRVVPNRGRRERKEQILGVLRNYRGMRLYAYDVADEIDLNHNSTRDYLNELVEEGKVTMGKFQEDYSTRPLHTFQLKEDNDDDSWD